MNNLDRKQNKSIGVKEECQGSVRISDLGTEK